MEKGKESRGYEITDSMFLTRDGRIYQSQFSQFFIFSVLNSYLHISAAICDFLLGLKILQHFSATPP